ncbi:MAG TPA: PIN domain-containing protein [Actinomycetota bacterium]|nr:PIN domain-containing protein [Actinomycetota bacterium]
MGRVVLDSTVVIDLLRGRQEARERLRRLYLADDEPYINAVVALEVSEGLRPRERDAAAGLFEGLGTAPLGIGEGRLAGWWRQRYLRRGRTLQHGDCLIGASAVSLGARLATGNPKDFPMEGLVVEHWPVGA